MIGDLPCALRLSYLNIACLDDLASNHVLYRTALSAKCRTLDCSGTSPGDIENFAENAVGGPCHVVLLDQRLESDTLGTEIFRSMKTAVTGVPNSLGVYFFPEHSTQRGMCCNALPLSIIISSNCSPADIDHYVRTCGVHCAMGRRRVDLAERIQAKISEHGDVLMLRENFLSLQTTYTNACAASDAGDSPCAGIEFEKAIKLAIDLHKPPEHPFCKKCTANIYRRLGDVHLAMGSAKLTCLHYYNLSQAFDPLSIETSVSLSEIRSSLRNCDVLASSRHEEKVSIEESSGHEQQAIIAENRDLCTKLERSIEAFASEEDISPLQWQNVRSALHSIGGGILSWNDYAPELGMEKLRNAEMFHAKIEHVRLFTDSRVILRGVDDERLTGYGHVRESRSRQQFTLQLTEILDFVKTAYFPFVLAMCCAIGGERSVSGDGR